MKKFTLIAACIAVFSTSALAAGIDNVSDMENQFYLRASTGGERLRKVKIKDVDLKLHANTKPFVSIGTGYYVMDNVRVEFDFEHFFNPRFKKTADTKIKIFTNTPANVAANLKGKVNALMLNALVDLFDLSAINIFVGGGAGVAHLKETLTIKVNNINGQPVENFPQTPKDILSSRISSKGKYNLAYNAVAGFSVEIAPGVHGEVVYSWKDCGKTKAKHQKDGYSVGRHHYRGHHGSIGIRVSM